MRNLGLLPSGRELDLAHRAAAAFAGLLLGILTPFWIVPRLVEMTPGPLHASLQSVSESPPAASRFRLTTPAELGVKRRSPPGASSELPPDVLETSLAMPELRIFSRQQSEGIFFDHAAHLFRHFGTGGGPGVPVCVTCHISGEGGEPVASPTFERACATCHGGEMERVRREDAGLPILAIPAIDLEAIGDLRLQIGAWPERADGKITAMMDLLLAAEPGYAADRALLEGLDIKNLQGADSDQMVALERVIWAIKRLYRDLLAGGAPTFLARLERATGEPLPAEAARILTQRFPAPQLREFLDRQLVGLEAEVEVGFGREPWKGGELPPDLPPLVATRASESRVSDPGFCYGWYPTGSTLAYRPVVHADPLQKALIDLSGSLPTEGGQMVYSELMQGVFCTRCHQLDVAGGLSRKLSWKPASTSTPGSLAHFSHRSHTGGEKAPPCATCHSVDLGKGAEDLARRSERSTSDFLPVHRTECIACHRSQAMADNCRSCHTLYGPPILNTVELRPIENPADRGE